MGAGDEETREPDFMKNCFLDIDEPEINDSPFGYIAIATPSPYLMNGTAFKVILIELYCFAKPPACAAVISPHVTQPFPTSLFPIFEQWWPTASKTASHFP